MQYFDKIDLFTRIHTKGTVKHFSKLFDHLTFFETLAQRRWQVDSKRFSAGSLSRVNARSPLDNVTRPRKIRADTEDHSIISIQLCFSWLWSHPKSLKEEISAILILAKRWHVSSTGFRYFVLVPLSDKKVNKERELVTGLLRNNKRKLASGWFHKKGIYFSNISEGTSFLLQGVTEND